MKPTEMSVADLMSTALITVNVNETIKEAHAEMELGVIRHLPVVDDHGALVGVLSDRDVLQTISSKRPRRVADVMTREPITISPDDAAAAAATLMLDHRVGSVLVVNEDQVLVGVVTQTDFLELARRALLGLSLER